MDINKMLDELRAERAAVEEAIITLERLSAGQGKRRGRPPAWLAEMRAREAGDAQSQPSKRAKKGTPQSE